MFFVQGLAAELDCFYLLVSWPWVLLHSSILFQLALGYIVIVCLYQGLIRLTKMIVCDGISNEIDMLSNDIGVLLGAFWILIIVDIVLYSLMGSPLVWCYGCGKRDE